MFGILQRVRQSEANSIYLYMCNIKMHSVGGELCIMYLMERTNVVFTSVRTVAADSWI